MARISAKTIHEVRALPILAIAEALGDTPKRVGASYRVHCPNPNHDSTDVYIHPGKGLFKCFGGGGCGAQGNDPIKYYSWHTYGGWDSKYFVDCVKGICTLMGISIEYEDGAVEQASNPRKQVSRYQPVEQVEPADADTCDKVYRAFLQLCPIQQHHAEEWLGERGYSKNDVLAMGLRSVPSSQQLGDILLKLKQQGISVERVPGFTQKCLPAKLIDRLQYPRELMQQEGEYVWYWLANAPKGGYFIPVRDEKGRIVRLRIRRDEGKPKYLWFSSSPDTTGKEWKHWQRGGAPSGAPINVVVPGPQLPQWKSGTPIEQVQGMGVVIGTEGEHKAALSATHLGLPVVGVPGVGIYEKVLPLLKQWNTKVFCLAYDMDSLQKEDAVGGKNQQVFNHLVDFAKEVLKLGIEVRLWTWNIADGKGLDDLLVNQKLPVEVNLRTKERKPLDVEQLRKLAGEKVNQ